MHKNRYIGITIGPIIKTISKAKETGQLWGASYIFSYVMRELVREIKEQNGDQFLDHSFNIENEENNVFKISEASSAGFFHDRCIFKAEESYKVDIENLKSNILGKLVEDLVEKESEKKESEKKEFKKYLKKYIQVQKVELCFDNEESIQCIMDKVNNALNVLELNQNYPKDENCNYLLKYTTNTNIKGSKLYKNMKANANKEVIPSTEDIASCYKFENEFQYGKYYAMIQVDADNMGKLISHSEKEEIKSISSKNITHAYKSVSLIENYGGFTYYAGGDDLLFMAPVINRKKGESIFDLVEQINNSFEETFKDDITRFEKSKKNKLELYKDQFSISFGITITYSKYPLSETLNIARELLFCKAKHYESNNSRKNAIAINFIKNSGKQMEIVFSKKDETYTNFKSVLNEQVKKSKSINKDENSILRSVIYKLKTQEHLVNNIMNLEDCEIRLNNYFENTFNEEIHKKNREYLKYVQDMIISIFKNSKNQQNALKDLEFYLKLLTFLEMPISDKKSGGIDDNL